MKIRKSKNGESESKARQRRMAEERMKEIDEIRQKLKNQKEMKEIRNNKNGESEIKAREE